LKGQLAGLSGGDVERGRAIFFGKKAACSGCHAVGERGGRVGPTLSTIGDIRQPGDLLESIVLPSASFARGFRSYTLATESGRVHTGVISRETTEAIWIKAADLSEIRVPRDQVEAIRESATSIMPKGLDKTLSPTQLADLLAFLRSCRADMQARTTAK
jgi:putative heme-binding domain-containing protein